MELPSLRCRPLLFKLLRLACLCLDEPFQNLPAVNIGSVDSEDPTSRLVDVILPVESYFRNIPHGVEAMTSDKSIAAFLQLEPSFGGSGLSDVYCPWKSVDFFGRAKFLEQLDPNSTCRRVQESDAVVGSSTISRALKSEKSNAKVSKKTSHLITGAKSVKDFLVASGSKS